MLRTSLLRGGVSVLALSAFAGFIVSLPASAADFTVPSGTTSGAQSVSNDDKGTIESGGTISAGARGITWTGGSGAPGVVIDNWGTITATRGIDTQGSFSTGSFTLNNYKDALISSSNDTFRVDTPISNGTVTINNAGTMSSSTGQVFDLVNHTSATGVFEINNAASGIIRALDNDAIRPGLGTILIENSGLIEAADRAINIEEGDLDNLVSLKVFNYQDGEINGLGADAIRVTVDDEEDPDNVDSLDTTHAHIVVDNAGTIYSGGGQAIDFNDISSADAKIEIINRTTGTITTDNADAMRPGANAIITNYGLIYAGGVVGSGEGNDAIDFQGYAGTVENKAEGEISGFRHGITTDVNVDVTNYGEITGRSGSGVGSDGDGTVTNYGRITGSYAGVGNGDGDGVDIDFFGTITNYGIIEGTGAGGVDSGGSANHSEGIAMGGGTIVNKAGALIIGADRGILIDDGSGGGAYGSVAIDNAGTIQGLAGSAIAIKGTFANSITNSGLITGAGSDPVIDIDAGDDTLVNSGLIIGNIDLGGGTNTLDNKEGGVLEVGSTLYLGVGNTLNNAGTISPGGTGTITTTLLTGSLVQGPTGALAIDINTIANTSDRINVTEAADLQGNVRLSVAGLAIASGTVTVLSAAGGAFHDDLGLIASPALQAALVYPDANTVQVSYALSFAPTGIGLNQNQSPLGSYLNAAVIADASSLSGITTALLALTTDGEYTSALDQLSPEIYGDTAVSNLYGLHTFGNALLSCRARNVAYVGVSEDQCLWASITGRTYGQDATATGIGYDEETWGFSGGGQVSIARDLVLGIAGGIERGNADTSSGASSDTDRFYAGAALKHTSGPWLLAGAVFGGTGSTDTTRPITFGGLTTTATGEQDISHLSARLRAAYQLGGNTLYAKPMVDLEATQLWLGSVQEQGGAGALSIASSEEAVFAAAPALEIGGQMVLDGGALLRPFVRAGAIFYSEEEIAISSSFVGAPTGIPNFLTRAEVEQVMGNIGAGFDLVFTDSTTIKAHYDGVFGEDTQQHAFSAKASVKF